MNGQAELIDELMTSTEARTHRSTGTVSPPSTLKISTPSVDSEGQMKLEGVHGSLMANLTDEDSHNPPSEFDIEVRIDRSILRDARQPREEQDLPALP